MKRKLFLSIFVTGLLANNVALQAKVECVSFVHGTLPVKFAHLPALAPDLYIKNMTMLNQYKLGVDLLASTIVLAYLVMIPGSIYVAEVRNAYRDYCATEDCKCTKIREATVEDYWWDD